MQKDSNFRSTFEKSLIKYIEPLSRPATKQAPVGVPMVIAIGVRSRNIVTQQSLINLIKAPRSNRS